MRTIGRYSRLVGLLFAVSLAACDSGEIVVPPPPMEEEGVLLDVAGTQGVAGNGGDGGPAIACSLFWPVDVTITDQGELLVVDWANSRIRKISPDGIIRGFIGSGTEGDDTTGSGESVDLNNPAGIEVGAGGNYVVADYHNYRVKTFDALTLECSVSAGVGVRGFSGDGGPASLARLDLPSSLVFDASNNMYILDQGNHRIRKVEVGSGIISTILGGTRGYSDGICDSVQVAFPGNKLGFGPPIAMETSADGEDIYLCDAENHVIRRINLATCIVTTVVGMPNQPGWEGDGGPALSAKLSFPLDVAFAQNGDFFVADLHNHAVRKVSSAGIITTVAGIGIAGSSPSGTRAVEAMLYNPTGVEFDDATNTLYIVEQYNHQVRKIINP